MPSHISNEEKLRVEKAQPSKKPLVQHLKHFPRAKQTLQPEKRRNCENNRTNIAKYFKMGSFRIKIHFEENYFLSVVRTKTLKSKLLAIRGHSTNL